MVEAKPSPPPGRSKNYDDNSHSFIAGQPVNTTYSG